jgi:hypothetical protein
MIRILSIGLLLLLSCATSTSIESAISEKYLVLGTARLKLVIPGEDWKVLGVRRRPDDSAVYYALASEKRDLVFSFFLDDAAACGTAAACRTLVMSNPAFKDARNLVLSERGRFSVAAFNLDAAMNQPVTQTHLVAEAVTGAILVDIHLSRTGSATPDAAPLYEFLKVVAIE